MASNTIIGSSVTLWVLIRPGIKGCNDKIDRRVRYPLEHGMGGMIAQDFYSLSYPERMATLVLCDMG